MQEATIPDFSRVPLYQQVRDALMARIQRGEWKGGESIPNEGDLARDYNVSSGTMRKTLDLLEFQKVLVRKQGRGTFIRQQLDWDSLPENAQTFLDVIGGGTVTGTKLKLGSGLACDASALREMADGVLEVAAWLERRMPAKGARIAA